MPQSVAIGLLVLGGVFLLIAVLGGNFKIFGAEVGEKVSSGFIRMLAGLLGIGFVYLALSPGQLASGGSNSAENKDDASKSSFSTPNQSATRVNPDPQSPPPSSDTSPAPNTDEAKTSASVPSPASPGVSGTPASISRMGAGIVFDPPSNVRAAPSASAPILCSVQTKRSINLLSLNGSWYETDACGSVGYIHQSQVRFSE